MYVFLRTFCRVSSLFLPLDVYNGAGQGGSNMKKITLFLFTFISFNSFSSYFLQLECSNVSAEISFTADRSGASLEVQYPNDSSEVYFFKSSVETPHFVFLDQINNGKDSSKVARHDLLSFQLRPENSERVHGVTLDSGIIQLRSWPPFQPSQPSQFGEINLSLNGDLYHYTNCKRKLLEALPDS